MRDESMVMWRCGYVACIAVKLVVPKTFSFEKKKNPKMPLKFKFIKSSVNII